MQILYKFKFNHSMIILMTYFACLDFKMGNSVMLSAQASCVGLLLVYVQGSRFSLFIHKIMEIAVLPS